MYTKHIEIKKIEDALRFMDDIFTKYILTLLYSTKHNEIKVQFSKAYMNVSGEKWYEE